jgi:Leucine-rich repeat (LRR) protein
MDLKKRVIQVRISFLYIPLRIMKQSFDSIHDLYITFQMESVRPFSSNEGSPPKKNVEFYTFYVFFMARKTKRWGLFLSYKFTILEPILSLFLNRLLAVFPSPEASANFESYARHPFVDDSGKSIWRKVNKFQLGPQEYGNGLGKEEFVFREAGYFIVYNKRLARMDQLLDLFSSRGGAARGDSIDDSPLITRVAFSHDDIAEIQGSSAFREVVELDLSRNSIKEIKNLESYSRLRKLDLSHNSIMRIENLDHLGNLEELWLCSNSIERIEGLGNLPNLRRLYLSDNHITRIENLGNLKHLEVLCLDRNGITRIENLDGLRELRELNLWNNEITSRDGLEACPGLKVVHLQGNHVSRENESLPQPASS